MVENPLDMARRFKDGLRSNLRSQMISLNPRDYNEIYEQAQAIEQDIVIGPLLQDQGLPKVGTIVVWGRDL